MDVRDLPQHQEALNAAIRGDYARARQALARIPDGPAPRLVRIDPQVFDRHAHRYDYGWDSSPSFLVVTPQPDRAAAAVYRASRRFSAITESGRHVADWEDENEYTPNWVSEVYLADAGLIVTVDTKGELPLAMGQAMLRTLADELIAEGVRALVTAPPIDFDFQTPTWPTPDEPTPIIGSSSGIAWYVRRAVIVDVGDGRTYTEYEYRQRDGGWTFDRSEAATWAEAPDELVQAIQNEPRPAATSVPMAVGLDDR